MEEVTFPAPPEGFEYKLVAKTKKPQVKDKDPADLTPKQIADLKYREKIRKKLEKRTADYMKRTKKKSKKKKDYSTKLRNLWSHRDKNEKFYFSLRGKLYNCIRSLKNFIVIHFIKVPI
ncbi:hypothetical protein OLOG_00071 [Ostreococcus lucimarinus virus OlV4]|nr:hypothetical protein OLOG_00071 [Ostreococcus lucimarinus virus OlV4]